MKKVNKLLIFILCLVLSILTFSDEINYNDYKVLLVGNEKGNIIKMENIYTERPFASITKMMTSLLVLEKVEKGDIKLTDKVVVSKEAASIPYGIKLVAGKDYTVKDLLKATIIRSSNNAAHALGEYVGGNIENFVKMMNKKAKELELSSLTYCSAHGLPPKYTGSCTDRGNALDLYMLSMELVKYKEYLNISKNAKETIDNGEIALKSTNNLLGKVVGVDGLKTGYHDAAGSNIILTAKRNNDRVFVIILGAKRALNRDGIGEREINNYYSGGKNKVQITLNKLLKNKEKKEEVKENKKIEDEKVKKVIIDKEIPINKIKIKNVEYGLYSIDTVEDVVNKNSLIELEFEIALQEKITAKDLNKVVGTFIAVDKNTNKKYSGGLILKK